MNKILKKLLCMILVVLTLFNLIYTPNVYATEDEGPKETVWDTVGEGLGTAVDGVAGILLTPAKFILLTVGSIGRALVSEIAEVDATVGQSEILMSLDDIFFHNVDNKYPILNVNFFKNTGKSGGVISSIKSNIAGWYVALRNLAIIISLLVLVYVGLRMAISTVAEDKAKYKKMFTDWVVGFILIFLLHYIIILTINVNEVLVGILKSGNDSTIQGGIFKDFMNQIFTDSFGAPTFTKGMAGAIIYTFMSVLIFVFLLSYIKRMLTVAFLIIIAPIITVTYSIDKMGDRKISSIKYMA